MIYSTSLALPDWVEGFVAESSEIYVDRKERVNLAISLSRENVKRNTGGPFGAAVFEQQSGRLIAVGLNVVVNQNASVAHAEVMALTLAQRELGSYHLGSSKLAEHELATSSQMCSMCYGAVLWSGVRSVAFGALASDVQSLTGFDEGPLPSNWEDELGSRSIEVEGAIDREAACTVLREYAENGGTIYNK